MTFNVQRVRQIIDLATNVVSISCELRWHDRWIAAMRKEKYILFSLTLFTIFFRIQWNQWDLIKMEYNYDKRISRQSPTRYCYLREIVNVIIIYDRAGAYLFPLCVSSHDLFCSRLRNVVCSRKKGMRTFINHSFRERKCSIVFRSLRKD